MGLFIGTPKLSHCRYITGDGTVSFSPNRRGGSSLVAGVKMEDERMNRERCWSVSDDQGLKNEK